MNETSETENDFQSPVKVVFGQMRPEDVDNILRVRYADEHISRLKTVIEAWQVQQEEERKLRQQYAKVLISIVAGEIVIIFLAFFLLGFSLISVEKWMAEIFLVGVLAQSSSLILVVLKYLFPDRAIDLRNLLESVIPGTKK